MEREVVHIGHRLLWFDVMVGANVPYRRLGRPHQNQKQALRDFGLCQVFFREFMLAFPGWIMCTGMPFAFPYPRMRRLKRPTIRIRCVFCLASPPIQSRSATTRGSRRDQTPSGNKHSTRFGPHNRSCRSTVPHTSRACFAAKHMLRSSCKFFRLPRLLTSAAPERGNFFAA